MGEGRFLEVFRRLLAAHGRQHWWPGDGAFEIMVGAVLTQNTAWSNVERALANLVAAGCLDARAIVDSEPADLALLLKPSGYFNVKAGRLQRFCRWYLDHGGMARLKRWSTRTLRSGLLSVNGVGPETADDILLYAFGRPVFVVDAYTRRLFKRLGLLTGSEDYETIRALFETRLPRKAALFNEYHALIVHHAKHVCRPRPRCRDCAFAPECPSRH